RRCADSSERLCSCGSHRMKAAVAAVRAVSFADYAELTKPRITTLVLATTLVGFLLGSSGPLDYVLIFNTLFGTALVAAGASALNMVLEYEIDAKMRRTEN